MSKFVESLESRTLLAATPGNFVVSFYGTGGAGGFGNDWLDKITDSAGEATNSTIRKYDENEGGQALKDLLRSLDRNRNLRIDKVEAVNVRLGVVGYSAGAIQAVNFARYLLRVGQTVKGYLLGVGVPVRSLVTLDPIETPLKNTEGVPDNVYRFSNYYQGKGGDTKVDLYTRTTPSVKIRSIEVNDPFNFIGDTLPTIARKSKQFRIDTDFADETEQHKVEDFLDGRLKGRNVNHGTVPFFASDFAIADLTA